MSQSSDTEKSFERGDKLMNLGRFEEAIPFLLKAHSLNPHDVNPVLHLSDCFYHLQKYDEALAYAENGIALVPHFEFGHRLRSIILAKFERFEESLESALEASHIAPESFSVLGNLVNAYLRANQLDEAKATAELVIRLYPEESRSHEKLADIFSEMEDHRSAELKYREAIKLNPENSRLYNQLGVTLLRQSETEELTPRLAKEKEAMEYFAKALKISPDNKYSLNNLKDCLPTPPDKYFWAAFIPFLVLGFIITPIWSILVFLLVILFYWSDLNDLRSQTDTLPPEMIKALKPDFYEKNFTLHPKILFPKLKRYFAQTYFQFGAALVIVLYFKFFINPETDDILIHFLKFIFVVNLLWIIRRLRQMPSEAD